MNYSNGKKINVGDRVELWGNKFGYVMCSMDDGVYTNEFSEYDWAYLKTGVIVKMDDGQLMHYSGMDYDLRLCEQRQLKPDKNFALTIFEKKVY